MPLPFLTYLTVFESRLGLCNLVLGATGLAHQPEEALRRKLRMIVDRKDRLAVSDAHVGRVFQYLAEKKLVSANERNSGRYAGYALERERGGWRATRGGKGPLESVPVYTVDIWMAADEVRST